MAVPTTFIPKVTEAGKAAAIDASNAGLTLRLTHVSFGVGQYDPTGIETALFSEVRRVPLQGGMRPRPNQMRVAGVWAAHTDESEIGEVGFWAGNVLFAVWSRAVGGPIAFKTIGVDFVLFCELAFEEVPAGSIEVVINTDISETMAALLVHEIADDAHTQYLLRSQFVDAQALKLAQISGGNANALSLRLPAEVVMTEYKQGQQIAFVAAQGNTGPVTVSVNAIGARAVRKNGAVSLAAGDIIAGAVYTLFFDGLAWQLSSGVGGAGATMQRYPFTATAGQTTFSAPYLPAGLLVAVNGRIVPPADYVAENGENVVLNTGATAGDSVELLALRPFSLLDTYSKAEADARFIGVATGPELSPPGMVGHFARETPPTGWLRCNGSTVSRTTYAALFAAIGTRFGAGDGLSTFRLPDLRGEFVRGWDDGRGVDTGRTLGSAQAGSGIRGASGTIGGPGEAHNVHSNSEFDSPQSIPSYFSSATEAPGRTGSTGIVRPRNVALLACIRF